MDNKNITMTKEKFLARLDELEQQLAKRKKLLAREEQLLEDEERILKNGEKYLRLITEDMIGIKEKTKGRTDAAVIEHLNDIDRCAGEYRDIVNGYAEIDAWESWSRSGTIYFYYFKPTSLGLKKEYKIAMEDELSKFKEDEQTRKKFRKLGNKLEKELNETLAILSFSINIGGGESTVGDMKIGKAPPEKIADALVQQSKFNKILEKGLVDFEKEEDKKEMKNFAKSTIYYHRLYVRKMLKQNLG